MPQVSILTPHLMSLLEANTNLHWEIEGLSGEWKHLKPIIRIESLTSKFIHDKPVLGAYSHETLFMREAELQIDLLASLIDLEWRISQFKANAVELPLDYDESSGWYIAGFKSKQQQSNFDWLDFYHRLQLVDVKQFSWQLLSPSNVHNRGCLLYTSDAADE